MVPYLRFIVKSLTVDVVQLTSRLAARENREDGVISRSVVEIDLSGRASRQKIVLRLPWQPFCLAW